MTKKEMEFIQSLDLKELNILNSLLKSGAASDASNYVQFILEHPAYLFSSIDLLKTIPIEYMPIIGISLSRLSWNFPTVYDYYSSSENDKEKIHNIGPIKKETLNNACNFLFSYLESQIGNNKEIYTGKMLLDFNISEKKEIVSENKIEIYDYLISFGSQYVFSFSKSLDLFTMPKQDKIVEILARYSTMDDLISHNIESFQKFIKQ